MASTRPNPYPGPRSFQQGERLFGRERETAELLDLLIAERIILLYSPSGAGKTSLVQAALIPELEAEGFRVLPTLRLGYLAADDNAPRVNRYLTSLLLSLERDLPEAEQTPLAELAGLSLNAYLDRQPVPAGDAWHGDVLIFDQFEEILTVDPGGRPTKAEFFEQVGKALRDRNRWALFAMREEFVAGLDPYLLHIPTRFDRGHRYRLELLGPAAAQEAMQAPARAAGVDFTDAAAAKLTDDLRGVRIQQPDGITVVAQGDYVEPVQLQVVCRRLWDGLAPDDLTIDLDDVQEVGDVDTALRGYYADSVAAVAADTGIRERVIREWIDAQLITAQGIRGQVLLGPDASPQDGAGLANRAIWPLVDAHLVRAEQRRGATWFELAHDRLIGPVRRDNSDWRTTHLSPLQRQAALWQQTTDQRESLLLGKSALEEMEPWAAAHQQELEPHELAFLEASRQAIAREEQARKAAYAGELQKVGWLALAETILFITVIVLVTLAFAVYLYSSMTYTMISLLVAALLLIAAVSLGIVVVFRTLRAAWYSRQGKVISSASARRHKRFSLGETSLLARVTGMLALGAFGAFIAMIVLAIKEASNNSATSASAFDSLIPLALLTLLLLAAAIVSGTIVALRWLRKTIRSSRRKDGDS